MLCCIIVSSVCVVLLSQLFVLCCIIVSAVCVVLLSQLFVLCCIASIVCVVLHYCLICWCCDAVLSQLLLFSSERFKSLSVRKRSNNRVASLAYYSNLLTIITRISIAPICNTRWKRRVLYNNTHTQTDAHSLCHPRSTLKQDTGHSPYFPICPVHVKVCNDKNICPQWPAIVQIHFFLNKTKTTH